MKFKLDENLPVFATGIFQIAGYEACTVLQQRLSGASDDDLFALMQQEQRVLVTLDLDFSDLRRYPPPSHFGVIILRPPSQDVRSITTLLQRLIPLLQTEPITHRLWIVETHRVRIRE